MSQRVSSRHEGDLGGRFLPFGDGEQVGVTVEIPPAIASLASVQHTAWMLVNLLARFEGVVHKVSVRCPSGVVLAGRVAPLAATQTDLARALVDGVKAIGVVPVELDTELERKIVVGYAPGVGDADLFAAGAGWCGGIALRPDGFERLNQGSPLPFGPYIAASIAASEVFKAARMWPGTYVAPRSVFYSAWSHLGTELPDHGGPTDLAIAIEASLVGVGAVGSAVAHALWACPSVQGTVTLIDNDPKGLETTNLNRYCIFGQDSVGLPKATSAAEILADSPIRWLPHDVPIESSRLATSRVVSAVDRNTARAAIQNQYPARLFSGSTSDLRAEILRCGPPGIGACLRCFNEPERLAPDEDLRNRLKAADKVELVALARAAGITMEEADDWVATGRCGVAGERMLPFLRRNEDESPFSVAFVSVMAGTLLAAELLKDHVHHDGPLSTEYQRATFQFFSPLSRSNRAATFLRDPQCPMCAPDSLACEIWASRCNGT